MSHVGILQGPPVKRARPGRPGLDSRRSFPARGNATETERPLSNQKRPENMAIPNYYQILSLDFDPNLTAEEIRTAYKKASLLTHPDRSSNLTEAERRIATENFQKVADAYYILSNPSRRKEYDQIFRAQQESSASSDGQNQSTNNPFSDPLNFFKSFLFNHTQGSNPNSTGQPHQSRPDPEATFADVFEDLLQPEIERTTEGKTAKWQYLGAASGGTLGFIVGNLPGLAIGSFAGNRLGAIRDAKGKSVYEVFTSLESNQKTLIIKALALKVLGYALG
ncbi:hypothetical protein PCANC_09676 [Puccinia coronata f. sp. avenae]|uniref:J domain-containing protein n=1 Tax=Puccinia coronata f. sp. avenae TaxID=200324 RepID=A0A2N5VAX7_9BASI|nr:hypothetical protein PCASD_23887 [Puccinia coronata f. sp. avenae]PLW17301.1 hypothetical protein PCANC_14145 [Puccinia coronata f. sp. avenae]PLW47125.1 hypothetical protein PCANC_09676 [Puccinia coronata f. sp. avenae]